MQYQSNPQAKLNAPASAAARARAQIAAQIAKAFSPSGVFLGFLALVLLMGGSARGDVASLMIIRPLAALVLAFGLTQLLHANARGAGPSGLAFPMAAFAALAVFAAVQLIPLPPSIWTALPGREPLVAGQEAAQIALSWQPISAAPMATINAFGALLVPLALIIMFAVVQDAARKKAVILLCTFMGLSAVIAAVQSMAPGTSLLYFYRVTNGDFPVGLFANRNHQAVMLAAIIPFILAMSEKAAQRRNGHSATQVCIAGWIAALGLAGLAVMTGSRAGAILSIAALGITAPLFTYARLAAKGREGSLLKLRLAVLAAPTALLIGVGALFMLGGGAAFERLAEKDSFGDLRFQILPEVFAMIANSMPLGWGFGTFPEVYEIYERREMIQPAYINHAHNDWLEIIIEGGLIAPLIAMLLALWTVRSAWRHRRQIARPRGDEGRMRFAALAGIAILIAGSAFDYPLRTPAGAAAFVVFLGLLAAPYSASRPANKRVAR